MSQIMLAPMEGVVDANMRQLLTRVGGIDTCVTEFIRITSQKLSAENLLKKVPELNTSDLITRGKTTSDVPVIVQFLGSDVQMLAYHAQLAVSLGAKGIDINFGCPSKTVNKHRGGAVLLDEPQTLFNIVQGVRKAVAKDIPVTAKMRLGNKDKSLAVDNAQAIQSAGANSLVVHARTKLEGYRPPAHWHWIRKVNDAIDIPVIANGDIWDWHGYQVCRDISGCEDVMIGRGIIANPSLAINIKQNLNRQTISRFDWADTVELIICYYNNVQKELLPPFVPGRVKQWLNMMRKQNNNAQLLFEQIKKIKEIEDLTEALENERVMALRER